MTIVPALHDYFDLASMLNFTDVYRNHTFNRNYFKRENAFVYLNLIILLFYSLEDGNGIKFLRIWPFFVGYRITSMYSK